MYESYCFLAYASHQKPHRLIYYSKIKYVTKMQQNHRAGFFKRYTAQKSFHLCVDKCPRHGSMEILQMSGRPLTGAEQDRIASDYSSRYRSQSIGKAKTDLQTIRTVIIRMIRKSPHATV